MHAFWSIATSFGVGGAAPPAGGLSSQTTAFVISFRADSNKSPASFSAPHTYWSAVTSSFVGGGTAPAKTTLPVMTPATVMFGTPMKAASNAHDNLKASTLNRILLVIARCWRPGRHAMLAPIVTGHSIRSRGNRVKHPFEHG